jgi:single-strand DNA-binding protein
MFYFNEVKLGGRVTADPTIKVTASGTNIVNFSLAVNRPKKDGEDTGTDFFDCVVFGVSAENFGKYVKKGTSVFLNGEVRIDPYTDKDGNKRISVKIYVNRWYMMESKNEASAEKADRPVQPQQKVKAKAKAKPVEPEYEEYEEENDLPF